MTNEERFMVGQMHGNLTHDCKISPESGCTVLDELTEGFLKAVDTLREQDIKEVLETEATSRPGVI